MTNGRGENISKSQDKPLSMIKEIGVKARFTPERAFSCALFDGQAD
jgi:hypothetical protein